jgi:hypothetical protein
MERRVFGKQEVAQNGSKPPIFKTIWGCMGAFWEFIAVEMLQGNHSRGEQENPEGRKNHASKKSLRGGGLGGGCRKTPHPFPQRIMRLWRDVGVKCFAHGILGPWSDHKVAQGAKASEDV